MPDRTEGAVLDVLAGAPLHEAAARILTEPEELAAAVEVYRQAGRRALERQVADPDWQQIYLHFTHWPDAERVAAQHLAPLLDRLQADGAITAWWFIRKHPCWRFRLRTRTGGEAMATIRTTLDGLAGAGHLERWWPGIYEAETPAFGGAAGMAFAHDLFHSDSRAVLQMAAHGEAALGRRELSILLCSVLMRAAGLEWYEQGDAWHRVTRERPHPNDIPPARFRTMTQDLRALMLADTTQDGPLLGAGKPLAFAAAWAEALAQAGRSLGAAARTGTLHRGLRHILAYHVIFHWNRLGLSTRTQSTLAAAARAAVLDLPTGRP